jgi:hypothetical protein
MARALPVDPALVRKRHSSSLKSQQHLMRASIIHSGPPCPDQPIVSIMAPTPSSPFNSAAPVYDKRPQYLQKGALLEVSPSCNSPGRRRLIFLLYSSQRSLISPTMRTSSGQSSPIWSTCTSKRTSLSSSETKSTGDSSVTDAPAGPSESRMRDWYGIS